MESMWVLESDTPEFESQLFHLPPLGHANFSETQFSHCNMGILVVSLKAGLSWRLNEIDNICKVYKVTECGQYALIVSSSIEFFPWNVSDAMAFHHEREA